jgi:hypothetical protein
MHTSAIAAIGRRETGLNDELLAIWMKLRVGGDGTGDFDSKSGLQDLQSE